MIEIKTIFSPKQHFKHKAAEVSSYHHLILNDGGTSIVDDSDSNHTQKENSECECMRHLKNYFGKTSISNETIFRFASYYHFQYYEAFAALQGYHKNRRLHLRMDADLVKQFETKTLFPLPGLKTRRNNCNVMYLKPSRFIPSQMKTTDLIDNLCYILNDISRTKEECLNGVALIANMEGWSMKNFSHDYCHQFMQALQGKEVPTRVELFLIVNPAPSFGHIWKIMKPMFSRSFAKKVHMIKEERLGEFLMDGCEQYLPDEFANGWKDTNELLEDLIDLKQYEDEHRTEIQ